MLAALSAIIVDIGLPGLNGYEVAQRIRERLAGRPLADQFPLARLVRLAQRLAARFCLRPIEHRPAASQQVWIFEKDFQRRLPA